MSRDPEIMSKNMRKIHSKDTSIEIQLRKALWHKGYRYRKNYKALPGSPDIVLTKYKIAIFCDSEFFHGKDWEILKLRLEKVKIQITGSKKQNIIVHGILKSIKSFYFSAIQLYISGDKTSKNILMSVSRPLKRLYGIPPFPMTLLNLQTNNKKLGEYFFRQYTNCSEFRLMNVLKDTAYPVGSQDRHFYFRLLFLEELFSLSKKASNATIKLPKDISNANIPMKIEMLS